MHEDSLSPQQRALLTQAFISRPDSAALAHAHFESCRARSYTLLGPSSVGAISYFKITCPDTDAEFIVADRVALECLAWKKCWAWYLALRHAEHRFIRERGNSVLPDNGQLVWDLVDACYQRQGGARWLAVDGELTTVKDAPGWVIFRCEGGL